MYIKDWFKPMCSLFLTLLLCKLIFLTSKVPVPVAAPSKAWVCSRSLAGIAGSNPAGGIDVCFL